jgi:hypothetical protein
VSIAAIDASGFDRVAVSRRYATQPNYRFQSLKTTLFVYCSTGAIINVHCSTTKPHETKIGWQGLPRNVGWMSWRRTMWTKLQLGTIRCFYTSTPGIPITRTAGCGFVYQSQDDTDHTSAPGVAPTVGGGHE